ncbi:MAG TPA: hypothetical protein PKK63_03135 [Bacillota bacterium]|nr:MAG: Tyrosine-protein phosphatase CpsB [Firmicutes bacterium ADurb.Bin153]HNV34507.1 hypothetical protein [Bacillota bacterium]HPU95782.1 hypothetical protein [Bacillota bacterium]
MIDIHVHILHGLDDGAMDIDEALSMLSIAEKCGVTDMIATPHSWAVDDMSQIERTVDELNKAAAASGISTAVHRGCEFNVMRGEAVDRLKEGLRLLTLAGGRYILTEFSNSTNASTIYSCIEKVKKLGLVPVIAHPERCSVMWDDLDPMRKARQMGAYGQISMGDMIGRNGPASMETAMMMIEEGLCQICATDAHTPDKLQLYMTAVESVRSRYGEVAVKRLFTDNPAVILGNLKEERILPAL